MPGLIGMKAICIYTNRSEATVLKLIRDLDFPAVKIGGIWESDTDAVDGWRLEQIEGRRPAEKTLSTAKAPQKPAKTRKHPR